MGECLIEIACLPLYSESQTQGKYVPVRNSLNMWNAAGRERHENEVGIPIPVEFRDLHPDFFPGVSISFDLKLPNFSTIKAKQCQQNGKALMSNPNKDLGKWILRDVLKIPVNTVVTYPMLRKKRIDSLYIEKWNDGQNVFYKIFPAPLGEYDRYIRGANIQRKDIVVNKVMPAEIKPEKETSNVKPKLYFMEGDHVIHKGYGNGIVKSITGDVIEIAFEKQQRRFKLSWLIDHDFILK